MRIWRFFLSIFIGVSTVGVTAHGAGLPFRDVDTHSPYYDAVRFLYDARLITDDGSHLFRPTDTIDRDAFIGLSISVSCRSCMTPLPEDIAKYQLSPFVDIYKTNQYYYCIAYGTDKDIIQGYILDASGKVSCQNGSIFSSIPFCPSNKTSRIEAVAMLLRQAGLWNDTLNTAYQKTLVIQDVSDYWYGYAQKGVQAGLLTIQDGKVSPNDPITRGEFALMAGKMLTFNGCTLSGINTLGSAILVRGNNGNIVSRSTFTKDESFTLVAQTDATSASGYTYMWRAINNISHETLTGIGKEWPSNALKSGDWMVEMSVIEGGSVSNTPVTGGKKVSQSSMTLSIGDGSGRPTGTIEGTGDGGKNDGSTDKNINVGGSLFPSVSLSLITKDPTNGEPINFSAVVMGTGPLTYTWDYGNGQRVSGTGSGSHVYPTPGVYPVTVTVTDTAGKTAMSNIVITVTGSRDSDGDGVEDAHDVCPLVLGDPRMHGCPRVDTNILTQTNTHNNSPTLSPQNTNLTTQNLSLSSDILIKKSDGNITENTHFSKGEIFSLMGILGIKGSAENETNTSIRNSGSFLYAWTAEEKTSGTKVKYVGSELPSSVLGTGNWIIKMDVIHGGSISGGSSGNSGTGRLGASVSGGTPVSSSTMTVSIGDQNGEISGTSQQTSGRVLYPSVTISVSTLTPATGETISYTANAIGTGPLRYYWDFGDGTRVMTDGGNVSGENGSSSVSNSGSNSISSVSNLSHTYSHAGTYVTTVTVVDAQGHISTSSVVIRVEEDGANRNSIGSSIMILDSQGNTTRESTWGLSESWSLSGIVSGGGNGNFLFTWSARDSISGQVITHTGGTFPSDILRTAGSWIIEMNVREMDGALVSRATISLVITDGSTQNNSTNTSGTNNNGDFGINGILYPSLLVSASSLNPPVGSTVGFTATSVGTGPVTYMWDFGDGRTITTTGEGGTTPTSSSVSHLYSLPGVYTVMVTLLDGSGKTTSASLVIRVGVSNIVPTIGSAIHIHDAENHLTTDTNFLVTERFTLVGEISGNENNEPLTLVWRARESISGRRVDFTGAELSSSLLTSGSWSITLDGIGIDGRIRTSSQVVLTLGDGGNLIGGNATNSGTLFPSVILTASTLGPSTNSPVTYTANAIGTGPLRYYWDFGDGTTKYAGSTVTHSYTSTGTFGVRVIVTDIRGNNVSARGVVYVSDEILTDSDEDGIPDATDLCPEVRGDPSSGGCPRFSFLGTIEQNACIMRQAQTKGVLIISPVCDTCPCRNTLNFSEPLRPCDIIFPTILSQDFSTIFSRGELYQIHQ